MSAVRVFTGQRVALPDHDDLVSAAIVVDTNTGTITRIHEGAVSRDTYADAEWIDAGECVIMPGIVDAHVHLNEPGRTDWEGFYTGTRAAASGGITTLVDMPLNSIPPTTTVPNLESKRKAAKGQCWTDVAFWGGVIPGNQDDLKPLVSAGVKGFKCFLIESGVDEFPHVSEPDLKHAMAALAGTDTVLQFHAELAPTSPDSAAAHSHDDPTLYTTFLESRPQSLEVDAIALITRLLAEHPSLRAHIVHLSASDALPIVKEAKGKGLKLTAETCYHYLAFAAQSIPDGRPEFKCCPPIRDDANRAALWAALEDGTIDFVVSDHSPCVAELKKLGSDGTKGDFMSAWGGISTLGLGLSVLWTELRRPTHSTTAARRAQRLHPEENQPSSPEASDVRKLVRWLCERPAAHASLTARKGSIRAGADADLCIWDPTAELQVTKESLNFKNKLSPYEGRTLLGVVRKTVLRGEVVYDGETGFVAEAKGALV